MRIHVAASKNVRQLSAWNVYVKQALEGQTLSPETYAQKMRSVGEEWKRMGPEERQAFTIEACHQEGLRSKLAETPFSVGQKKSCVTELERSVGRNGCKHFSARRLTLNKKKFEEHSTWHLPTSLGDSFFRCKYPKQVYFLVAVTSF